MKYDHENLKYLMETYARFPVAFVRGEGMRLWDSEGREYLDFLAGLAVANLGHCPPTVVAAIRRQAGELMHVSNYFHIPPQLELARALCERSFADRVFFCNSGTEANEAALKLARKWGRENRDGAFEIITTEGAFHGRTMFSLSVTHAKFQNGFAPLIPGVTVVAYDDPAALEAAITPKTAAVIVEPIQGERGVRVPADDYLARLREICDRTGALLIFDEVQTGMGRTGRLFAHESSGVVPDLMTLAKALGSGFPIGAVLATERVAKAFGPGAHGATFGGNPMACVAGLATLAVMDEALLQKVRETGAYFLSRLRELAEKHDCVEQVRGRGLLLGLVLDRPGRPVVERLLERGLIVNCASDTVLRFAPPLIIGREEIDRLIPALDAELAELERTGAAKA